MIKQEITATLEDWYPDFKKKVIRGKIFGDNKKRFADGRTVETSVIPEMKDVYWEGDIVETEYSNYKLGKVQQTRRE